MQSYFSTFQCCRGKKYRSTNLSIPAAAMCSIIYVCWYFIVIVLSLSLCVQGRHHPWDCTFILSKKLRCFCYCCYYVWILVEQIQRSVFLFRFFVPLVLLLFFFSIFLRTTNVVGSNWSERATNKRMNEQTERNYWLSAHHRTSLTDTLKNNTTQFDFWNVAANNVP